MPVVAERTTVALPPHERLRAEAFANRRQLIERSPELRNTNLLAGDGFNLGGGCGEDRGEESEFLS